MRRLRSFLQNLVELCCLGIFAVAVGTWSLILGGL